MILKNSQRLAKQTPAKGKQKTRFHWYLAPSCDIHAAAPLNRKGLVSSCPTNGQPGNPIETQLNRSKLCHVSGMCASNVKLGVRLPKHSGIARSHIRSLNVLLPWGHRDCKEIRELGPISASFCEGFRVSLSYTCGLRCFVHLCAPKTV